MTLKYLNVIDDATEPGRRELFRFGIALVFIIGILLYTGARFGDVSFLLVVAGIVGGYMAMNIGANDVANNVGPAVGARALTMAGAILIAAVCEAAGALIAGGDVVGTIRNGIIAPDAVAAADVFVWLMLAAMLAGALWLNIATAVGAPISTTHSIVGGVLGAGVAAGGWSVVDWVKVGQIAASWIISPLFGGIIAAAFLLLIKRTITYKTDVTEAAARVVPLLIAAMTWAFSTYLVLKGLKHVVRLGFLPALAIGLALAVGVLALSRPLVARAARALPNDKRSVNRLFTVPLIFAAALLSFSHGANDVANAVGPLAAIHDAVLAGAVGHEARIPPWIMLVGAIGIAIGLALYGPRLIRTVGSEITDMDQMRAFSIAMAAATTVLVASQLGLPVSSTHIAVGGVFGVGFLREYIKSSHVNMLLEIRHHHQGADQGVVEEFLGHYEKATLEQKAAMLADLKRQSAVSPLSPAERKMLKKAYRKALVKRTALLKIVAAWLITLPVSGLMAALLYFTIRGMLLP
ncbi:MAG: inorganic phosphate transporter [Gammaproteobacteria bacterium]|nr:inorganic phosphate transporter [Gammaproteobacteria bacterium]MCP5199923.1 inorganic phosphate transporter [Gammaproteobacteria bacterium]